MYVEVIIEPGVGEVQFCAVADVRSVMYSAAAETRIVLFFTTPSEAQAALSFAGRLAVSSGVHILLVCMVTRSLLGRLRLERFVRYAKRIGSSLAPSVLHRLRLLVLPCNGGHDVVEDFIGARSIVLTGRGQWRPWGHFSPEDAVMNTDTLSILL
jgi:hypothetical protein